MRCSTRDTPIACLLPVALWLCTASLGCSKHEPSAKPEAQRTQGGDSSLDRAGHNIDEAHREFKRDVKSTAEVVDEKANAAVSEGRKAVDKVVDAVDGSGTSSAKPKVKPKDRPKATDK